MKHSLIIAVAALATAGCKKTFNSGVRYGGTELMGVSTDGLANVAGITDTPSAGAKARELNAYPSELEGGGTSAASLTGYGLAGGSDKLVEGNRICVSADYGRAGNGGGGNSHETAAKCGYLERCEARAGWYADLPAKPGDLCMRADCLSKNTAGLDMPGEVSAESGVCDQSRGNPTAFNVSEYFRALGAFAVNSNGNGIIASATANGYSSGASYSSEYEDGFFRGDKQYNSTSGVSGQTAVTLADERLYSGEVFMTVYKSNAMALNPGGEDSVARVGFNKGAGAGAVISLFEEGGSEVNVDDGGSSGGSSTNGGSIPQGGSTDDSSYPSDGGAYLSGNAPTAKELGIVIRQRVKTRQGNSFSLSDDISPGQAWLGPSGTVKVLVGGRQ